MILLQTLWWFFVALIVLVAVHEFGHFYVARRCGVKVLRFSIGFGKVLLKRTDKSGTEFTLSAIPLGGYVKMLDEREGAVAPELLSQAFNRKTVYQRMAIVAAGPVANFLLAILLFWGLMLGTQRDLVPVVGEVVPGSLAAQAGIDVGQEILAVDGIETPTRQKLYQQLLHRLGESGQMQFSLRYGDADYRYQSYVVLEDWLKGASDPDPLKGLGISFYTPDVETIASQIIEGSPAEQAGVMVGDKVLSANGTLFNNGRDWIDFIKAHAGQKLNVLIEREGQVKEVSITPESIEENGVIYGRVGMALQQAPWPTEMIREFHYSPWGALKAGVEKTWDTSAFVFLSIKKLVVGEISTKNLSGPVSIAKVANSSAQSGWKNFIGFLALLSIFLGVFNLLPIPMLDGGHLLYFLIELVKGSPVSEKTQMIGFQIGLFFVIGLSVFALYNDIMRL